MKNRYKMKNIVSIFCLAVGFLFASCSDWTDQETLKIKDKTIDEKNPALYAKYLEDLKTYKKSKHAVTYAWFDNSVKVPFTRAQNIDNTPDSVDVVVLMHPDNLVDRELKEMDKIRNNKGMKILLEMSYNTIKSDYEGILAAKAEAGETLPETDEFPTYLKEKVKNYLDLVAKFNYDGIIIGYKGKNVNHMTEEEKATYISYEAAYLGDVMAWYEKNQGKSLVFAGLPQYVVDKAILQVAKHIILPTTDAASGSKLDYHILQASVEGVPTDRFIVTAYTQSVDKEDTKTGYWGDQSAIISTATWIASKFADETAAGIGIYNLNNDYFNIRMSYQHTRTAIAIMNPTLKN